MHAHPVSTLAAASLGALIALVAAGGAAQAGNAVNTGYFGGVAIMGYDHRRVFHRRPAHEGLQGVHLRMARHALVFREREAS